MGIVYEAADDESGRTVAIKVLVGTAGFEEKAVRRFLREAEMLQRITHPHIVPIYRFGEEHGTYFYAMQLVDGQTVATLIRKGPLDPMHAARITHQAARALEYAHERTIVHRDIKPANLMVDRADNALLTDFGLATHERAATITDSGALVGTPMYMSPEQVSGAREGIDFRTDVYSLGATLYEMVTGRPPFESDNVQSTLRQIVEVDPRPPRRIRAGIPRDLETITLKAMEKIPANRYPTAHALAEDLECFLGGKKIRARRRSAAAHLLQRGRRHPRIFGGVAILVALLAASLAWGLLEAWRHARERGYRDLLNAADAAERAKDWSLVLQKLDEAIRRRPSDALPLLRRGMVRAQMEQESEARSDFLAAAEREPGSAQPWLQIASLARASRDREAALAAYEEARRREPTSPLPWLALHHMALAENDFRRANAAIESAREVAPNDHRVLEALAFFAARQGRPEEAARLVSMLQLLNPLRAAPSGLGEAVVDAAQRRLADLGGLPDTLRRTPEVAGGVLARVQANIALAEARHRIQELTEHLGESVEDADDHRLRLARAEAYRDAGEFDAAATDLVLATQSDPRDPEPWRQLARMHLDETTWANRNLKEALRFAREAVERDGSSSSCQEALADSLLASGRADEARSILDELLQRTPEGAARERLAAKRSQCEASGPR
jgi:tetratricopeptide (TPR) repeat protein